MTELFLIACLTLVVASGKITSSSADPFVYHYNHVPKHHPKTPKNFVSDLPNNGEDAILDVDEVPSIPDLNNGDYEDMWQFSPLVNSNKDYLYDYVGDNWLSGEDSPYFYYSEGKGSKEKEQTDKDELPAKHRRKYRRLRSLVNRRKRESGHEVRPTRKTSQFVSNRMKRAIKFRTPNFFTNAENVHPASNLQFNPIVRKRDVQFKTADLAPPIGRFQKYRLSRRDVKRLRRQLKAHQLEYFTDNDGDSQFHAPGKDEGTEWDLVPLDALKDDSEEQLGIQYDKKANDASFLISE